MRRELTELQACLRRRWDEDTVHALRVSARRLECELAIRGVRVLRSDLGWLRRAFAEVRDLDVAMASWREPTFVRWCAARRARAVKALARLRGDARVTGLVRALGALPDEGGAPRSLSRWRARVETRRDLVRRAPSLESLHALRRAVRRLRYGLERRGEEAAELRALQSALGEVCDLVPLLRLLNESGQRRVARRLQRRVERAFATV